MKGLALMSGLLAFCSFAEAAAAKPKEALSYSKTLGWEKTPDKALEFPHPIDFAVTFGIQGFEDSLLFMSKGNASLSIMPLGKATTASPRDSLKAIAQPPAASCSAGAMSSGRLENNWPAAWIEIVCPQGSFGRLIARVGGNDYLVSGAKVTIAAVKSMAAHGRVARN